MFLKYRDIVISRRKPGELRGYPNLEIKSKLSLSQSKGKGIEQPTKVVIKDYEESIHGLIMTFTDRYPFNQKLYDQVNKEWGKHKDDLKIIVEKK